MSLYFIFTVDGDWDEYFSSELSKEERKPNRKGLVYLINHEIEIARFIGGKVLHFVHTSPVAREYFLQPNFIILWKKIEQGGGSIGVHCHEEDLFSQGRLNNPALLEKSISSLTDPLRREGLTLISYRGGYLTFCRDIIPILEKRKIFLDFSCDSGRYLRYKGKLIADWKGVPDNYYRISYDDHRRQGNSKIIEIPLGKSGKHALYIDITSLKNIWKAARALAKRDKEKKGDKIVSILTHTYEFSSFWKRLRIKLFLLICRRYGTFVSDKEALEIINTTKGAK